MVYWVSNFHVRNLRRDHTEDQAETRARKRAPGNIPLHCIVGSIALSCEGMELRHRGAALLFFAALENLDRKELRMTEDLGEG